MFMPFKQFAAKYPWPSEVGLRNWYFRSQRDPRLEPLRRCFKKLGKRVVVDSEAFFKAVEELNERGA